MKSFNLSRLISLILTVAMLITAMPLYAFAEGISAISETAPSESESSSQDVVESKPFEETILLKEIKKEIAKALNQYLGKLVMSEEEVKAAVSAMDEDTQFDAWFATDDIRLMAEDLTDAEAYFLLQYEGAATFGYLCESLDEILLSNDIAWFTTVTVLDGKISIADSANSNKVSGGTVTITAKGSLFGKKTNNITITNASGSKANISFDYSASGASSFKIAGADAATSGSYSAILDAGATLSVTLVSNSGLSGNTATLTMSNFSLIEVKESSNVTVNFDSSLGSVTAGGNAVKNGDVLNVSGTSGVALSATAKNGSMFLGWTDDSGKILSTAATYTFVPAQDVTVKAAFAVSGGTPWFGVGSASSKTQSTGLLGLSKLTYYQVGTSYLFDDLNAAAAYAAANSTKTLVLMNNATLPAGDYTIPSGVTLLVPFDQANTMFTTEVVSVDINSYATPTAYRTLTLADGANIAVNGSISVSAKHTYANGSKLNGGSPTGNVAFIKMNDNSKITVNNGGALYAYGFITGSGSIVANSGASVYENFQIMDFRGGSQSTDMENGVFPLSQYYLQNIEVPLTIYSGAKEYAYTTVYMSSSDFGSAVAFIANSGAMFNLTNGYVVKDYDENTDRLVIKSYGDVTVSSINMSVGTSSINSKNYDLGIQNNMTVEAVSGNITINQDIAFLPGSQIIIGESAKCTLGSGYNVYVYDADEWGTYASALNKTFIPVTYAPGRLYTRDEADLVDAKVVINGTIDASQGYIYTTAGGADISGNGTVKIKHGTQTVTYQIIQAQDVSNSQYIQIPLTLPAQDGWEITHNENGTAVTIVEPTCTEVGSKQLYCSCGAENGTKEISAKGHTKGSAATCTTDQVCTVCNAVIQAAMGHNLVVDDAVAPSCTETGLTEGSHCSRCSYVEVAQQTVPATGHSKGEAANCTDAGVCIYCGHEMEAALGHNHVVVPSVAPTCTTTGLTEGIICDRCGYEEVKQEIVPVIPHTEAIDEAVAPTCTETGLSEGKHCSVCNAVIVSQSTVAALGHSEVIDEAVEPNCTDTGLTEGKHCSVCGTVILAQEVLPIKHEWVEFDAKAPTRTESGYEAHLGCQLCGETTDFEVIPPLGQVEIDNYKDFIYNLTLLEEIANEYVKMYPSKDPVALVIKYIRTGVERYNSGSWGIMAGYEDADFAAYVIAEEDRVNAQVTDGNYLCVTGLKNLKNFTLPNGDKADIGHVFGAMDITYHNNYGSNHTDVSGWAGDLVDLLEVAALEMKAGELSGSLDEMIAIIGEKYFRNTVNKPNYPSFSQEDYDGDLDAYYVMNVLKSVEYGLEYTDDGELDLTDNIYSISEIFMNYMNEGLTDEYRAAYFMTNRLGTNGTRAQVRNAVYTEYLSNNLLATLEGTRDLTGATDLNTLRRAVCYAFADYVCLLAGDYVADHENPYYNVFSSSSVQLAPGITQEIHYATSADGKQMVYYIATGDITRGDVHVYANYNNNDPSLGWEMSRVEDQANAAQANRGDPNSPNYIENYNVIASINGAGFNMSTGEPGGLLVMDGKEYHGINGDGFFGILDDGTAVIGTTQEYNTIYKDRVKEGIAGFGATLIKDGEIAINRTETYYSSRASRTAIGITKTGKVVFMVLDGRQEPFSCGGSMEEIAQIMFDAGCVQAINLDGGGSTTFVAKQPGDVAVSVVNRPSDGFARSVSTSLLMVSTAPSSTEFDHAIIESEYKYSTIGTTVQMTAKGISPAGNEVELPEGYTWAVSDDSLATISEDGVFTGIANGAVDVYMMLGENIIGMTTMNVVVPENVYFTRTHMDAVYGANTELPVAASYNNKPVAFSSSDIEFILEKDNIGTINGNIFVGNEDSGIKVVNIKVQLVGNEKVSGTMILNMFKQGENTFDFNMATGGDRQFAWLLDIENANTFDGITYTAIDLNEKMTASYVFAIDMTQIPIPGQLADLVYMLPGADASNASAWNFLLQLAERVSVLTEITATIDFDDNVVVDYSALEIRNEYFTLTTTEFDETTNSLTLKLNWIDQTKAIDPITANPLCMVKGIKVTAKDGAIEAAQNRLNIVNSGTLSYKGYLRANALYSFAQKPENQLIYGLQPFVNPDPQYNGEAGAWFGATYATFEDSYTLAYDIKEGWTVENGGFAYYVDGEKLTGVQKVDGLYYDFGENGINAGQTTYTGLFFDKDAGVYRYAEFGVLSSGWKQIGADWYYFRTSTMAAAVGSYKFNDDVTYYFENTGKISSGVWVKYSKGLRYWYGPTYYVGGSWGYAWYVINDNKYCFNIDGYALTGVQLVLESSTGDSRYYKFDEYGACYGLHTGLVDVKANTYYAQEGVIKYCGLFEYDGAYYYADPAYGYIIKGKDHYVYKTNDLLPRKTYTFDENGKIVLVKNGIYNGYYYVDDMIQYCGLFEHDGYYYYADPAYGNLVTGKDHYVYKTNDLLPRKMYTFDEEGRIVFKNGIINGYYYINDVVQYCGLFEYEGHYYYADPAYGYLIKDKEHYVYVTNDLLPRKSYTFDSEGKLVLKNGIINGYYYINDVVQYCGLFEYEGHYYYADPAYGYLIKGKEHYVYVTNDLVARKSYTFDDEGRLVLKNGIINGYYYINDVVQYCGLFQYEGAYYYADPAYGNLIKGQSFYVYVTNGLLARGTYSFDENGKLILK